MARLSGLIPLLVVGALVACTKKEKGEPIVIPPGQLIEYSNADFLKVSGQNYTVDLQRLDPTKQQFFSIEDISPKGEKDKSQDVSFILPKDKNDAGIFVVRVSIPRYGITMAAVVLPGRKTQPGIATTLAAELFENYTARPISELSVEDVVAVEGAIEKSIARVETELRFTGADLEPKARLRFLRNFVARDDAFHEVISERGYSFKRDGEGTPSAAPYPFGSINKLPLLDEGNSTATRRVVTGREAEEIRIDGKILEPDADYVLARWSVEGKEIQDGGARLRWTPGYADSRDETYKVSLWVTDGGVPRTFSWDVRVFDTNRPPEITHDCKFEVKEWEKWSCTFKAKDYDGDPLTFLVSDKATNARAKIEGQQTDDTTRKITISGKNEITVEITPDNRDARKRSAPIEITVDDGKLGSLFFPVPLIVEDINEPPVMRLVNGSPIIPMIPGDTPREWDYCTDSDPDGIGPYHFMIEVYDPDNLPSAGPRAQHPDIVSVNFGGSLKSALTEIPNDPLCPASTAERSYFCFEWKPKSLPRSGTLTLNLKDDHGGNTVVPSEAYPDPVVLASADRNVRPCITGNTVNRVLSENLTFFSDTFDGEDGDGVPPYPEIAEVPENVMPLLQVRDASNQFVPPIFRKTFFNAGEWLYRFPKAVGGTSNASYQIQFRRPYAGAVVFRRAARHTGPVTIPAGVALETNTPTWKVRFQTAVAVTANADDKELMIPVVSVNRTVAVGKVNRFISSLPFTASVTNTVALTATGTLTISRPTATTAVIVPVGTEVGSSELADGTDTFRYELAQNLKLDVGVLSGTVLARRKTLTIPASTVVFTGAPGIAGPAFAVENTQTLIDKNDYTLARDLQTGVTLGSDRFCWKRRAADAAMLSPSVSLVPSSGAPLETGLSMAPTANLELEGWVKVQRTSAAGALTIPAGYEIRSADFTRYVASENLTIPAGTLTAQLPVRRTGHISPPSTPPAAANDTTCMGWSDVNFEPVFLNGTTVKVPEGGTLLDFEFRVTDNAVDPAEPRDYLDRHTFAISTVGTAPVGSYLACRAPGTDVNDITVPTCEPCTTPKSSYFESALCYLRFKPVLADASERYNFNAQADDHGLGTPLGTNVRNQAMTLAVIETNDPPVFTNSNFLVPLTNSLVSLAEPLGEYIEGLNAGYRIYITDPDKGTELKTQITPALVKTWQFISPAGWTQVTNPAGLSIGIISNVAVAGGWGSQTTVNISWTASDADAKRFAGAAGGVLELKACDQGNADSPRQCRTGFYGFTTRNVNNIPSVVTNITTINTTADIYNQIPITVQDADSSVNPAPSGFQTFLSMCSSAGVYDCPADLTGWPVTATTIDEPYAGNSGVAQCRSGAGLSAEKYPQFTRTTSPFPLTGTLSGANRQFGYRFSWCPQRRHIGSHVVYFTLADNGDEDYRGPSSRLPAQRIQIPLQLKVVAPIFFESPLKSPAPSLTAARWLPQAFSLAEYRYPLIINASKGNLVTVKFNKRAIAGASTVIGNPSLEVRNYSNLAVVAQTNVTQVTGFNPATQIVYLVWKPYGATATTAYVSNPADQNTWPQFEVQAQDQTTGELEKVQFRVQVKDSLSPFNSPPTIDSTFPGVQSFSIPEQIQQTFAVTASETTGDTLMYRWYLDGKLISDAGNSWVYLPEMDAAFTGAGGPGRHTVLVEVADGQERGTKVTYNWNVYVRNTVPLPQRLTYTDAAKTPWSFTQSAGTRYTGPFTSVVWGPTVGAATTLSGTTTNSLLFAGSYLRSGQTRHFVWRVPFLNTVHNNSVPGSLAQGIEFLPWATSSKSEQITYSQTASALSEIRVSSRPLPTDAFSSSTDAVKLNPTLTSVASIGPAQACTLACASGFFMNAANTGQTAPLTDTIASAANAPMASYVESGNTYAFYAASLGRTLQFSRTGASSGTTIKSYPGNDTIASIAVNSAIRRLYVTVRDPALARNFIEVYDISGVAGNTVSALANLPVSDGVNADNRILDLAVDTSVNRVYALLPGTGGVVYFDDSGSTTPVVGDLRFIGVAAIGSSFTDAVGGGRKLVFNPTSKLLVGIAKDSSEVFIIDTMNDAFGVKVFRSEVPLDEVVVFANDGLVIGIARGVQATGEVGRLYYIR